MFLEISAIPLRRERRGSGSVHICATRDFAASRNTQDGSEIFLMYYTTAYAFDEMTQKRWTSKSDECSVNISELLWL